MNLSKETKIVRHSNAVAVGTAAVTPSAGVDMKGFDNCMFVVAFGTITDGPPSIKVQQSSDDGVADGYSDLTGTSVAVANSDDNKLAVVEVARPAKRYLKLIVTRGGATGCVLDGIVAILSGPKHVPITLDTTVAASETHVTPAEGTA